MKLGFVGLGRMGFAMAQNLAEHKHSVVVYNRSPGPAKKLSSVSLNISGSSVKKKNISASYSLEDMVLQLPKKKIIWLMVTAGKVVDNIIFSLIPLLKKGDIIIDGGNSFYRDSIRRNKTLKKLGIHFFDCGTSGGIEGARYGACMMIGGEKKIFETIEPLFKSMCVKNGYGYMGKSGGGHFVKMVHNGIEYGMMGAINEGFLALEKYERKFGFDLNEISKVYANGSIIEGRLIGWLWKSFKQEDYLNSISCEVPRGETEKEIEKLERLSQMKILEEARLMRKRTRKMGRCGKLISAMRNQFGGHSVKIRI
jgi:6-phosphogluconate dehydrogenase